MVSNELRKETKKMKLTSYHAYHRDRLSTQDKRHFDSALAEKEEIERKQWQLLHRKNALQAEIQKLIQLADLNDQENQ
tara:strand:+ start:861 stop:1094 length:234 start_codon:yes stop_codon:yes gene_type:complete